LEGTPDDNFTAGADAVPEGRDFGDAGSKTPSSKDKSKGGGSSSKSKKESSGKAGANRIAQVCVSRVCVCVRTRGRENWTGRDRSVDLV